MFASRVTKDVVLNDGDLDVTVTIQKLSARALEKAREAKTISQAAPLRAMGGDILKAVRSESMDEAAASLRAKRATIEGAKKERYDAHDRFTVLQAGIVRWRGADLPPVSPKSVEDLDEDSAQRLHEEIVDLSLPPIDPAELEERAAKD